MKVIAFAPAEEVTTVMTFLSIDVSSVFVKSHDPC